jgi:hypothetical protein
MKELSLHLLDLIENSVAAGATRVSIAVVEDAARDELRMTVSDNGRGMTPEMAQAAADPFTTSRETRSVGMGLSLLAGAAEQAGGEMKVTSQPGQGTTVEASLQLSHIDRAPLGRVEDTLATASALHPDLDVHYAHQGPRGAYEIALAVVRAGRGLAETRREIARLVHEGRTGIGSTA